MLWSLRHPLSTFVHPCTPATPAAHPLGRQDSPELGPASGQTPSPDQSYWGVDGQCSAQLLAVKTAGGANECTGSWMNESEQANWPPLKAWLGPVCKREGILHTGPVPPLAAAWSLQVTEPLCSSASSLVTRTGHKVIGPTAKGSPVDARWKIHTREVVQSEHDR